MKSLFAENLRYLRKQKKLSQTGLAEALGLSRSNIASYEFGGSEPNIKRLLAIGKFFGISLDALLGQNIEKAMYDRRIKEKPLPQNKEIKNRLKKVYQNWQEDCDEVKAIKEGSQQFVQFKQKKWSLSEQKELMTLLGEYEKMIELNDFLLDNCENAFQNLLKE